MMFASDKPSCKSPFLVTLHSVGEKKLFFIDNLKINEILHNIQFPYKKSA